ncbi:hypothetical protein HMPREF3193_01413 [Bifidobacterium breve]|uniref:Uncharacterized protein n=1 Tax=Bifidobacterium breve DSM 20213 = JCM 1192 TaxID=518634 RepID=D4BQF9_BIFBR|nr:hypothetical protein BIFBRE_04329 [Bifidobacterium breve DSM 20213 = JCM 1192]KWZ84651.1 hypothetical protein HMPREF3193_01413 [Bifidobacterium breve]
MVAVRVHPFSPIGLDSLGIRLCSIFGRGRSPPATYIAVLC